MNQYTVYLMLQMYYIQKHYYVSGHFLKPPLTYKTYYRHIYRYTNHDHSLYIFQTQHKAKAFHPTSCYMQDEYLVPLWQDEKSKLICGGGELIIHKYTEMETCVKN